MTRCAAPLAQEVPGDALAGPQVHHPASVVVRHQLGSGLVPLPGEERGELLPRALEFLGHRALYAGRCVVGYVGRHAKPLIGDHLRIPSTGGRGPAFPAAGPGPGQRLNGQRLGDSSVAAARFSKPAVQVRGQSAAATEATGAPGI